MLFGQNLKGYTILGFIAFLLSFLENLTSVGVGGGALCHPPPYLPHLLCASMGKFQKNGFQKIKLTMFQQLPEQVEPPIDQVQEKPEHRQDQLEELVQKPDLVFNNNTCGHNFDLNILKQ
jgi:hypothetical protein